MGWPRFTWFLVIIALQICHAWREACPTGATGDFPYSLDCRKYLSCWKGRGVLRLCSPGTLFNPRTVECDFPDKVTCHTHTKRSDGTHWHTSPSNLLQPPEQPRTEGNLNRPHNHHHHHHHHNHPPGKYWNHNHQNHQHHHHHTHGFNGLPTYTPNDRRFYGASRRRTDHSGVQPPTSGSSRFTPVLWTPAGQPAGAAAGSDYTPPASIPGPTSSTGQIPAYGQNPDDCDPPQGKPSIPLDKTPPSEVTGGRFSPIYPNVRSPSNPVSSTRRVEDGIPVQQPTQDFDTDQLPLCDEPINEDLSRDSKKPGFYRQGRLVLSPEICPQGFSGLTPHPDCTKFLSCANGRTFVMNCSPGTRFNPSSLICDHPEHVKCAFQDLVDLDPAGSSISESHQQILSDKILEEKPRSEYDFDIDVRFGESNSKRCRPWRKGVTSPAGGSARPRQDVPDPDRHPPLPETSLNQHYPQHNQPNYNGDVSSHNHPNYTVPNYSNPSRPSYSPNYSDTPQRPNRPNYSDPPQLPNRPNYSDPPQLPNRPNYGDRPEQPNRPNYGDRPQQPNRPDYSDPTQLPNRPSYSDPPQRPNRPNYSDPPQRPNRPNYSDPPQGPNRPDYSDPSQRPNRPNYSDPPQLPNRPNYSDPPQRPNRPNYSDPPERPNRPDYSDTPQRPNRPDYSDTPQQPIRPIYNAPPPRQFGPNYIDSSIKHNGPDYGDSWGKGDTRKTDSSPDRWITTTVQPFNTDDDILTRFGDLDWQESKPSEKIDNSTDRPHENIQNQFEVITTRPVVVTGRTVRTKPTTTQTTTAPPTKQHVMRPDIVISSARNNKTKSEQPGWQVLRLRGGPSSIEGFVEIQITFGAWGILCDQRNQWSLEEANIVCKNLGYSRGADQSWQGKPAEGRMSKSSVIAANNVRCLGHEENILECYISGGGNCDVERDAVWVRCHPNSVSSCQPGETSFDGKCYSLVVPKADDADTSVGFSQGEALAHCKSKGARLADFTSQQENDHLSEWLVYSNSADSIMTSGVGVSVMGHSIWIWEGSEDPFSYNNWWPGWGGSGKGPSPQLDSGRALCIVARRYFPCASYQVASTGRSNSSEPLLCDSEYFFWDVEDCGAMSSNHPYICERPADKVGCVVSNGESYTGPANVSELGVGCLHWENDDVLDLLQYKISEDDFKKRLSGHNSCRNVGGNEALPWCYANTTNGVRKQLCDIPKCGKGVQQKSAKAIEYTCGEEEFSCQFNYECIPSAWICDGQQDCPNGADEADCSKVLDKFSPIRGHRLYGHDSEKWLQTSAAACAQRCLEATSFQCRSFSHSEIEMDCILSDSNVGLSGALSSNDTSWHYYELNSLSIRCTEHFLCDSGKCISIEQRCNGHNDCGDKSDEKNCTWTAHDIQLRLTGSPQPHRGTIEIKFNGEWGLVCDDEFDLADGAVICRQLGYSDVSELLKHSMSLSNPNNLTKYQVDNLQCHGNETHISQCEHNGWGIHDCAPTESAGLVCKNASVEVTKDVSDSDQGVPSNMWRCDSTNEVIHIDFLCDNVPDCTDRSDEDLARCKSPIEVRLVGVSRSSRPEGRLEVKRFGVWGTVCDDDFGSAEAQVVCNTLGHKGPAKAYKNAKFGAGAGVIWMDSVHCAGNESGVERCLHEGWGQTNCKHDEDVSVVCSVDVLPDGAHSPSTHSRDENDELFPSECGSISRELDSSTTSRFSARVVSGFETIKGTYPWQASVRLKSAGGRSAHWCGAIVVGRRYALTAGHCLRDYVKSHYFIRAGDYDTQTDEGSEQDLEIEEMWIHEELDRGARLNNDLALVRVKPPGFNFNAWVQPACMPKAPLSNNFNCTISGWGTAAPGSGFARTLHGAWLSPLSRAECSSERVYGKDALSRGMFCAGSLIGGPDSCQGDSGGPFVCPVRGKYTLYGITSWGHGCGRSNSPGVYTDLWYYRNWLSDTLARSTV